MEKAALQRECETLKQLMREKNTIIKAKDDILQAFIKKEKDIIASFTRQIESISAQKEKLELDKKKLLKLCLKLEKDKENLVQQQQVERSNGWNQARKQRSILGQSSNVHGNVHQFCVDDRKDAELSHSTPNDCQ
eukprot:CAMPEP_0197022042 /NCGR_PEP_ID=MMETSP1384-20130603/2955_1 /TAXON_ID=29189 /ORGANISM="Ammonia sp." /LENGTH=134 /DNA_ID=CAMNT_0042450005 /DNA_START=234 /DNA_END=638 /DNA_ORIENTATION=+